MIFVVRTYCSPKIFEKIIMALIGGDGSTLAVNISGMRKKYKDKSDVFTESDITDKNPYSLFKIWFDEACKNPQIFEANAMCLATASRSGMPSCRYVLLKGYGTDGFKFYTNYESRKGKELAENPVAALNFYWAPLARQVRIEGVVEKLSEQESDEYFHSRPVDSQIGACISHQSTVISGREELIEAGHKIREDYVSRGKEIPRPNEWGGFIVKPTTFEFWQGQSDRVHDRIRFRRLEENETSDEIRIHKGKDGWVYERLAP
ncbi:pyridoxine/pyridoxamine 5'-phosphate oxidase-like [Schistocerca cancellata]|uniref:pyridoxine/pyridoxamine 5'-phosphate oxidase-like n=1 Tax=Schistocerca cancellata TaxID=274614 RepID=UPI002118EBAD|nr:pyridoxine/pyridoxamine 5'-phosphate oxidase-like [Schistocerca cancellata]